MRQQICITQDLLTAVDGGGSVRDNGFNALKTYTMNLLSQYHSQDFWA